jgi:hypothetical protein
MSNDDSLPTDLASAHALIIAQRAALLVAQGEAQHRADREAQVHDQEAAARAVRTILGAWRVA